jgi:hypothetical protein
MRVYKNTMLERLRAKREGAQPISEEEKPTEAPKAKAKKTKAKK